MAKIKLWKRARAGRPPSAGGLRPSKVGRKKQIFR